MSLDKKITDFLDKQIPEYVQEYYPIFVIFVTKYYQWLEQGGNPQEIIQNIQLNADIDTTASSLATKFVNTYAPNLPQTSALDRTVLVKNFRDFYRSKGSLKSFEFFFRAFFDDDITVKLPGDSLFRTSGGDWYVEKTLRVRAITGNPRNLEHVTIQGNSSNATAIIEHAVQNYGLWDLTVQNRSLVGTFSSSETITGTYWVHTATTSISSQIVVQNTAAVNVAAGRQRGTRSQLSSDQVIQDSIYWQRFSYVIRTRITLDRWKDAVLEQLHPSGRNLFGEILLDSDASVAVSAVATTFAQSNAISTEVRFSNSDDFIIQPGYSFDRLANFRTGTSTTTSAGAITYAADFVYGGENITFALQNAADNIRSYVESFSFTSITGTVSAAATTGNTALNRDTVSYTMPVTSITGTISGGTQPSGGEMVVTGSGTLFTTEIPLGNIWRYYTGTVDAFNNPIYAFYSSVLTVNNLPIAGTVTLPIQTPAAPNYYYYASGAGTTFLSDLLVTGGDTSTGISNETNQPIIFPGQRQPQVIINNILMTGNPRFTLGSTNIYDPDGKFLSQMQVSNTVTVIKQLSGRLTQVSSLPAITSSYNLSYIIGTSTTILGSSLTTVSSTGSSRTQESSLATTTDPAMFNRWDLEIPFPVYFLGTSSTRLYVHSTGMISPTSSVAAHGTASTAGAGPSSFQPAIRKIYINPYWGNKLKNLYYQTFGVTPSRTFKIYYDGWFDYPYQSDWEVIGVGGILDVGNNASGITSNVLTTGVGLTLSTSPTSGTLTNGFWQLTIPFTFRFFTTATNQLFISHHGRVSFSDWKDGSGNTITTNVTTSNGLTWGIPNIPRIEHMYIADSGQGIVTSNNPRAGNRIYFGVTSGSTSTTSRVFTIRWEGGVGGAFGDRTMAWEMSLSEQPISPFLTDQTAGGFYNLNYKITLNGALSPYQSQFNLASWNLMNVPLWKVGLDGVAYQEPKYYNIAAYQNLNSTSYSISFATIDSRITTYNGNRQQWEATFYENSSNGLMSLYRPTGNSKSSDNPPLVPGLIYDNNLYGMQENLNPLYIVQPTTSAYGTYAAILQNIQPEQSAITSVFSLTSSTSMLFRLANISQFNINYSNYTENVFYISALTTVAGTQGATTAEQVTSMGVIARWSGDRYTATAGNPNPNPTCIPIASSTVTVAAGRYSASPTLNYGTSNSGVLYTSSTATITRYGFNFAFGSSATTHNRWIMTTATFGMLHAIRINGYVNSTLYSSIYPSSLAIPVSGQNLELFFSTSENPIPPGPGETTPDPAGWTRFGNLYTAGSSPESQDGLLFNPILISSFTELSFGLSEVFVPNAGINYAMARPGIYAMGRRGAYTGSTWTGTDTKPFKLTWLIFQKTFSSQATPDQRTSEYLLSEISTAAYPTGYFNSSTKRIVAVDPNVLTNNWEPYYYGSASVIRLRDEIGSGSVVRIAHPTDRIGGTTTVDYVVSQDPIQRATQGDFTLVLRATTSVTNTGFTTLYDGTSSGSYFKGISGAQAFIVETRTVASIESNTSATVNLPWSSTSIRYWGNNTSSTGTAARAFNLMFVNNDTSLTLQASSGDSSAPITIANAGLTIAADRRFIVTGVNTSSNMTVSGGGVYANFAGKTATFARYENSRTSGFLITGYHNGSNLTSDTTWVRNGVPGIDNLGVLKGNVAGTTLKIGNSSFSVVSVVNDTAILVTGSIILTNFYNTGLTMYFPSYSSNISVTGISTLFLPQITTGTATSAGVTIEEVTESGRTPDFRYGFLQIGNTSFAITSIVNDTSLIVAGGPITESFAATSAISYVYRRDYPLPRVIGAPDSASFDKAGSIIGVDDSLVTQGNAVDFTTFRTLYHSSSYTLSLVANDVVLSTSITVNSASSLVLLLTWMKDFTFNAAEGNNRFAVSVSSAGTFRVLYDNEIQQNYKDVAVGQTLLYSNTFYVHSSNTISSTNVVNSGATTSQVVWTWIPYNANRSGVYDRLSARFESRGDSSINISVTVPAGYQWNSTTSDFVNITVLGAA